MLGHRVAERRHPVVVGFGEVRQHVAVHQFLDAGMTDAEPHPAILVADMGGDRAQAVVAGDAAADLHPHLAWRQFELVMEYGDVARRDLEEACRFLNAAAGIVHVSRRLEQDHALSTERAFRGLALKPAAPWRETVTPRDLVDGHEA